MQRKQTRRRNRLEVALIHTTEIVPRGPTTDMVVDEAGNSGSAVGHYDDGIPLFPTQLPESRSTTWPVLQETEG